MVAVLIGHVTSTWSPVSTAWDWLTLEGPPSRYPSRRLRLTQPAHPYVGKCSECMRPPFGSQTRNSSSLFIIFAPSHHLDVIPSDWKIADTVPIYKKGRRAELSNYRPVSMTSVTC